MNTTTETTSTGHCQICGNIYKLRNGKVALHGFKNPRGPLTGRSRECDGSNELPLERSISAKVAHVTKLQARFADNVARINEILAGTVDSATVVVKERWSGRRTLTTITRGDLRFDSALLGERTDLERENERIRQDVDHHSKEILRWSPAR